MKTVFEAVVDQKVRQSIERMRKEKGGSVTVRDIVHRVRVEARLQVYFRAMHGEAIVEMERRLTELTRRRLRKEKDRRGLRALECWQEGGEYRWSLPAYIPLSRLPRMAFGAERMGKRLINKATFYIEVYRQAEQLRLDLDAPLGEEQYETFADHAVERLDAAA